MRLRAYITVIAKRRTKLDDLLFIRIPPHDTALPVAFHRHAAGDGDAKAQLDRAVRLLSGSDAVHEILHVGPLVGGGRAGHLLAVRTVHLFRQIADPVVVPRNRAVGSEDLFGVAKPLLAESRIPREQQAFSLLHRDAHSAGHLTAVFSDVDSSR